MKIEVKEINEKREYLHKLIDKNSLNILSKEVINVSQELDKLIYQYYQNEFFHKDTIANP